MSLQRRCTAQVCRRRFPAHRLSTVFPLPFPQCTSRSFHTSQEVESPPYPPPFETAEDVECRRKHFTVEQREAEDSELAARQLDENEDVIWEGWEDDMRRCDTSATENAIPEEEEIPTSPAAQFFEMLVYLAIVVVVVFSSFAKDTDDKESAGGSSNTDRIEEHSPSEDLESQLEEFLATLAKGEIVLPSE